MATALGAQKRKLEQELARVTSAMTAQTAARLPQLTVPKQRSDAIGLHASKGGKGGKGQANKGHGQACDEAAGDEEEESLSPPAFGDDDDDDDDGSRPQASAASGSTHHGSHPSSV